MSHNATGYDEDMNPDLIDGIHSVRDQWSNNNVKGALAAEAIVAAARPGPHRLPPLVGQPGLDAHDQLLHEHGPGPGARRLVRALGHAGRQAALHLRIHGALHLGLDDVSRLVQGRADLGQGPSAVGVLRGRVEFAVPGRPRLPHQRGGEEETSAGRPSSSARGGSGIAGTTPIRSARPSSTSSTRSSARISRKTGGPSAPGAFRRSRPGSTASSGASARGSTRAASSSRSTGRACNAPGSARTISANSTSAWTWRTSTIDWVPTADGQAILRNNQPLLAYIAGKPAAFTGKDHNFYPGETVEKQIIVINNSRETVTAECGWSMRLQQGRDMGGTRRRTDRHRSTDSESRWTLRCRKRWHQGNTKSAPRSNSATARYRRTTSLSTCCRSPIPARRASEEMNRPRNHVHLLPR